MDYDRLNGLVWGAVAGGALGLPHRGRDAEFLVSLTKDEVDRLPQDRWGKHPPGSWTGSLDAAFLPVRIFHDSPVLTSNPSREHLTKFLSKYAEFLRLWARNGFTAWHDPDAPYSVDSQTLQAVDSPGFTEKPLVAATHIPQHPCDCASLLRVLLVSTVWSPELVERYAGLVTECTYTGPSVVAGAVFVAHLLGALLHQLPPGRPPPGAIRKIAALPLIRAKQYFQNPQDELLRKRFFEAIRLGTTEKLKDVGGRDYGGRHLSSLRCVAWALSKIASAPEDVSLPALWRETMAEICRQGGSSDVNCALVGAVLGAVYGGQIVPKWVADTARSGWVEAQIAMLQQALSAGEEEIQSREKEEQP